MKRIQKHLAWLFYAYALIEIFDWFGILDLLVHSSDAAGAATSLGMSLEALYWKSGILLVYVGFLIINSIYMGRYLSKNPHLAKIPVGVTYSVLAMLGYAWLWILQGIIYSTPNLYAAGAFHLIFALVIALVAEKLPEHEPNVTVTVKNIAPRARKPARKAAKKKPAKRPTKKKAKRSSSRKRKR